MQINGGAMNRFAEVSDAAGLAMGYYNMHDSHLWKLAREFTLGDAMFHSAFGGSFLNDTFLVCSLRPAGRRRRGQDRRQGRRERADGEGRPGDAVRRRGATPASRFTCTIRNTPTRRCWCRRRPCRISATGWTPRGSPGNVFRRLRQRDGRPPGQAVPYHHQPLAYFRDPAPGTPAQRAHLQDYTDLLRDIAENSLPPVVFYKPMVSST